MEANKTYILQLKPIAEITEEERKIEVLATNGKHWIKGIVSIPDAKHYECKDKNGTWIGDVTHFAVLSK